VARHEQLGRRAGADWCSASKPFAHRGGSRGAGSLDVCGATSVPRGEARAGDPRGARRGPVAMRKRAGAGGARSANATACVWVSAARGRAALAEQARPSARREGKRVDAAPSSAVAGSRLMRCPLRAVEGTIASLAARRRGGAL